MSILIYLPYKLPCPVIYSYKNQCVSVFIVLTIPLTQNKSFLRILLKIGNEDSWLKKSERKLAVHEACP